MTNKHRGSKAKDRSKHKNSEGLANTGMQIRGKPRRVCECCDFDANPAFVPENEAALTDCKALCTSAASRHLLRK
eukprot:1149339-Pelagomonas_calceolata.AAC.1